MRSTAEPASQQDRLLTRRRTQPPSLLLQLPGQTADLKVALTPGKYYFQCDPNAALGMKGKLEVEEKE